MTAAAVGTCAWAEGEQTLLNESFTGWTLTDNTWWSYSAEAADGELTLTEGEDAKLSLNTGSKVLTGSFTSDDQPKAIGNGLYFNAKVTFKDPSDTLPTLGEADKFALVVLDNAESIDAEKATAPATNLMVIAKYGTEAQRAYELNVAVDSDWLDDEHEIVVKAYDNVMKSGSTACAGFLVMVDETVCKVVNSYAIVDGVVDFGVFCAGNNFEDDGLGGAGQLGYLGYAKDAIAASMQLRYENAELLLSNVPGSDTLASVDFQGQGVIDDVSLATTGADFGADALVFTVEVSAGVTLTSDATVYYGAAGETKNITFTLAEGYVLKAPTAAVKGDSGVYTYAYETVADNNQVVNIEAYKPAAYIGDTAYETFAGALAAGGTIKLAQKVAENITIAGNKAIVLDLNGFDIEGSNASRATIVSEGNLTITNSVADKGSVVATAAGSVVNNGGVLNVQAGTFTGLVKVDGYNDEFGSADASVTVTGGTFDGAFTVVTPAEGAGYTVTATVTGGKFLKTSNASVAGVAEGYEATDDNAGYWVVDVKPAAPAEPLPDLEIDENATAEEEKAAVTEALGTQADAAVVANITNAAEYAEFKSWAGTNGGAATVVASVNAWIAYALDNADLLDDAKVTLTDNDITVESFGQAENAAAGQFTLEISLKDVTIGAATKANLLKIFEAVGAADLKQTFTADAVTTDVVAADGNAKFTVAPSAATKPNAFFFKAQIKK